MPLSQSQIKSRLAQNLYYRTMSLIYGISSCSADYSDEQFQDDWVNIDLLESRRDCRYLKLTPLDPFPRQPIILNFDTCVQLPINTCNL